MQLLEWQNLIFLVPIGMGTLLLMLMIVGTGLTEQSGDADIDQDTGLAVDQDADLDQGVDVDQGADVDHGADAAHGDIAHAPVGALQALAGFLGIGRVPVSILMMSYCFVWGAVGLCSITLFGLSRVSTAIWIALGAAVLVTRYLAVGIARLVPSVESYHTPPRQLVGLRGKVLFEVTEVSGQVRVHDTEGNLRDIACRVAPGVPPIPADRPVVLLWYDAGARVFFVEPAPPD